MTDLNEKNPEGFSSSEKFPYLNSSIDKLLSKYDIRHPKPSISRNTARKMLIRDLESERSRLIDEIEAAVRDIRWPDKGNGAKGSIMWSQFIGHEKALDKVKKILEEAKNG